MKKGMLYLAAVLCAAVLTGCIGVEYIGQNFPELPESMPVMIFDAKNPVPPGEFQVIGKLKLTIPPGMDMVIVQEAIEENARERGASAARIVAVERIPVNGAYAAAGTEDDGPRMTTGRVMLPDGSAARVNSFGEPVVQNRVYQERFEHVVKVQLLLPVKDFNRAVALRRTAAEEEK